MIKLVSHCHTHHSFDSSMSIESLIDESLKFGVNCIVINDHDVFSVSEEELNLFKENNILVIKAIEFTTKEGVHVIGIDNLIEKLEKPAFHYTVIELLECLNSLGGQIVFPHPFHSTGIYGNSKVDDETFCKAIECANGFEVDNYRYGPTPRFLIEKILNLNNSITKLIGSDAHKKGEVAAFVNVYETIELNDYIPNYTELFSIQPKHLVLKKRSNLYFKFKKFQKSSFYQSLIGMVGYNNRQKIKMLLKFGNKL